MKARLLLHPTERDEVKGETYAELFLIDRNLVFVALRRRNGGGRRV